jgi:hypothetical protein
VGDNRQKFYAGVLKILKLVERRTITGLHSLGALNGARLWEAEWISCPLDVPHLAAKGKVGL